MEHCQLKGCSNGGSPESIRECVVCATHVCPAHQDPGSQHETERDRPGEEGESAQALREYKCTCIYCMTSAAVDDCEYYRVQYGVRSRPRWKRVEGVWYFRSHLLVSWTRSMNDCERDVELGLIALAPVVDIVLADGTLVDFKTNISHYGRCIDCDDPLTDIDRKMLTERYGLSKTQECLCGIGVIICRTKANGEKHYWGGLEWVTDVTDSCFTSREGAREILSALRLDGDGTVVPLCMDCLGTKRKPLENPCAHCEDHPADVPCPPNRCCRCQDQHDEHGQSGAAQRDTPGEDR